MTFPSFTDQARRVLGERYRELMTPGYVTHLILMVSTEALEKRPQAVASFMAGLMKADSAIAADPAAAQQSIVRVTGGVLKVEAVKANWPDYDYRTALDVPLLSLMVEEGEWVKGRGLIKNVEPTEALFRSFIADAPLKALAPDRVQLP